MQFILPYKRPRSRYAAATKFDGDGRPDFLCIGAQKAGTTWLYHQLNTHPSFWMPPVKELHYFDQMSRSRHPDPSSWRSARLRDARDQFFVNAMDALCATPFIDRRRYGQVFAPKGELLSGDITPLYSALPEEIIAAVIDYFPQLKIVFIARDPVERAWSALSMGVKFGGLSAFDPTSHRVITQHLLHPDIIMRSFPSITAARWRRHIPAEQMRVYFFDDLERNPAQMRSEIIRFLGADPARARETAEEKINQDKNKLPMTAKVRNHIARFFAHELKVCASELGGAAVEWPGRYGC